MFSANNKKTLPELIEALSQKEKRLALEEIYLVANANLNSSSINHPFLELIKPYISENLELAEQAAKLIIQHYQETFSEQDFNFIVNNFPNLSLNVTKNYLKRILPAAIYEGFDLLLGTPPEVTEQELAKEFMAIQDPKTLLFNLDLIEAFVGSVIQNKNPQQRLAYFETLLNDKLTCGMIFRKEPGVIYGGHPAVAYFLKCLSTDKNQNAKVAERILDIYDDQLICFDYETLYKYSQLQNRILFNYPRELSGVFLEKIFKNHFDNAKNIDEQFNLMQNVINKLIQPEINWKSKEALEIFAQNNLPQSYRQQIYDNQLQKLFTDEATLQKAEIKLSSIADCIHVLEPLINFKKLKEIVSGALANSVISQITPTLQLLCNKANPASQQGLLYTCYKRLEDMLSGENPGSEDLTKILCHAYLTLQNKSDVEKFFLQTNGITLQEYAKISVYSKRESTVLLSSSSLAFHNQSRSVAVNQQTAESKSELSPQATQNSRNK